MLSTLRKLFEPVPGDAAPSRADLELAAAVLLVEVARSDYADDEGEYRVLIEHLRERFTLDAQQARELLERAETATDHAVSLDRHVGLINRHYDRQQKFELIGALWAVAFGDGELHHYEEHLIRRIADLLYVPHGDFIRAKHRVVKSG